MKAGRKRKLTCAQEIELVVWWRSLKTTAEKARELGVSPSTVRNALSRHGLNGRKIVLHKDRLVRNYLRGTQSVSEHS